MLIEEITKRVNELYHKSKNEGLTEAELIEQKELREAYIANVRNNLKGQLDNINIENEDGTIENLGEKYGKTN